METNYDELYDYRLYNAETLSKGWVWVQYCDGSGNLKSPESKSSFLYDLTTYRDGVEYKKDASQSWDIFWGSFEEFKEYAESITRNSVVYRLRNKPSRDNRELLDIAADEIERLQGEIKNLKQIIKKEAQK